MNKIKSWVMMFALIVCTINIVPTSQVQAAFAIYSADDLLKLSESSDRFYLAKDIDMSSYGDWKPIRFCGTLLGNGHVIRNLTIREGVDATVNNNNYHLAGLFSEVEGAHIKNVGFENVNICLEDLAEAQAGVGAIAGIARKESVIEGCYVTGKLSANYEKGNFGGLVGIMLTAGICESYNEAELIFSEGSTIAVGGVCGYLKGDMAYCYNVGHLQWNGKSTANAFVGGLAGYFYSGVTEYSYAAGSVSSSVVSKSGKKNYYCGMLFGYISEKAGINALYYEKGNISGYWSEEEHLKKIKSCRVGLSTEEMKEKTSYIKWHNFDDKWEIDSRYNNQYPVLITNCKEEKVELPPVQKPQQDKMVYKSGKSGKVEWVITKDGKLTLSGKGNPKATYISPYSRWINGEPPYDYPWVEYGYYITSAELRVEGMTHTSGLFEDLTALKTVDLSHFDASKVKDMSFMFNDCVQLEKITYGKNFNTKNVTRMVGMFSECMELKTIDLSKYDMRKVESASNMFSGCSSLKSIKFGKNCNFSKLKDIDWMFTRCENLSCTVTFRAKDVSNWSVFTDAATKKGSKIIVNYGGNCTKEMAQQIVDSKSKKSNVVLGKHVK